MKAALLFIIILWAGNIFAEPRISVNGLFVGKAIIKINGAPVMFYEGDQKQGIKLISANENRAIIEVGGKRQTMFLDLSIANEYSKPVKVVPYGQTGLNQIHNVEIVHQTENIATFMVEYQFDQSAENYILIAQAMVDKKAVDYATYNYVPLKAGKHRTYISVSVDAAAPPEYQSDHMLFNFANKKTKKPGNPETAKILSFTKKWRL